MLGRTSQNSLKLFCKNSRNYWNYHLLKYIHNWHANWYILLPGRFKSRVFYRYRYEPLYLQKCLIYEFMNSHVNVFSTFKSFKQFLWSGEGLCPKFPKEVHTQFWYSAFAFQFKKGFIIKLRHFWIEKEHKSLKRVAVVSLWIRCK